jgi:peptidoglycan biosynthesis protein MviN/MurJ (putative lipid II flippase)
MSLKPGSWRIKAVSTLLRSDHGTILRDMTTVAFFLFLAKLAAAAKEMVVAWRYGTGTVVDAYLFVFNIVSVPVAVWYSVLSVVLIPLLARLRQSDQSSVARFRRELLGCTIIVGIAVGFSVWLLLRLSLAASSLGLPPETRALAVASVDWLVWLIPLGLMVHFGSVLLMASGRHTNSLLEGAQPLTLLLLLLLLSTGGIWVLIAGTLLGALAQLALTAVVAARGAILTRPLFSFTSPAWSEFRAGIGLMLIAQAALALTTVVDQLFAADLGVGAISTLGYSNRVLGLFLSLGATAVGRATLPIYSRVRYADPTALPPLARKWCLFMLVGGGIVWLFGWMAADWMVRILFERGAFTHQDTLAVSAVLRWGLSQIPFYFAMFAASMAVFSFGFYRTAAVLAVLSLLTKTALSFLLVPQFGLSGLMLSTTATYAVSAGMLFILLGRFRTLPISPRREHD